jgi:hypothetical protein
MLFLGDKPRIRQAKECRFDDVKSPSRGAHRIDGRTNSEPAAGQPGTQARILL